VRVERAGDRGDRPRSRGLHLIRPIRLAAGPTPPNGSTANFRAVPGNGERKARAGGCNGPVEAVGAQGLLIDSLPMKG